MVPKKTQRPKFSFCSNLFRPKSCIAALVYCIHCHFDFILCETQCDTQDCLLAVQQFPTCLHRHLSWTRHPLENEDSLEDAAAEREACAILRAQAPGAENRQIRQDGNPTSSPTPSSPFIMLRQFPSSFTFSLFNLL